MKTVASVLELKEIRSNNNYPLCRLTKSCSDNSGDVDPSTGPSDQSHDIITRSLGITFETIYRNIASYPNEIDITDPKYITRTYYLEEDKKITINIDMGIKNRIVATIDGDTGYDTPLVRTRIINGNKINTVYNI